MARKKKNPDIEMVSFTIRIPWETRIACQKAAEREKISYNEWYAKSLIKSSQETLTGKREIARPEDIQDKILQLIEKKFEEFDEKTKELYKPAIQRFWEKYREKIFIKK